MTLPELTVADRQAAGREAVRARRVRAAAKSSVRDGKWTVADVLAIEGDDEALGRMPVLELVASVPRVGKIRAAAILAECDIAKSRRLRGLGDKQRAALMARCDVPGRPINPEDSISQEDGR